MMQTMTLDEREIDLLRDFIELHGGNLKVLFHLIIIALES